MGISLSAIEQSNAELREEVRVGMENLDTRLCAVKHNQDRKGVLERQWQIQRILIG